MSGEFDSDTIDEGEWLKVLPDVRLVIDPANNPDEDNVLVFGLRVILSL